MATSSLVSWISEPLPLQHHNFDLITPHYFSLSETSSSSASIDNHSIFPQWTQPNPLHTAQPQTSLSQPDPLHMAGGRVTKRKRKSRASKLNLTTYISTDTSNFREMVQHVTGVGFDETGLETEPGLVRPEPKRAAVLTEDQQQSFVLPTLDTSAFILERNENGQSVVGTGRNAGFQTDPFSFFPTLESWSVM